MKPVASREACLPTANIWKREKKSAAGPDQAGELVKRITWRWQVFVDMNQRDKIEGGRRQFHRSERAQMKRDIGNRGCAFSGAAR